MICDMRRMRPLMQQMQEMHGMQWMQGMQGMQWMQQNHGCNNTRRPDEHSDATMCNKNKRAMEACKRYKRIGIDQYMHHGNTTAFQIDAHLPEAQKCRCMIQEFVKE